MRGTTTKLGVPVSAFYFVASLSPLFSLFEVGKNGGKKVGGGTDDSIQKCKLPQNVHTQTPFYVDDRSDQKIKNEQAVTPPPKKKEKEELRRGKMLSLRELNPGERRLIPLITFIKQN